MTMMNRRQFVYGAAAGAAMLTRATDAFAAAADYDLILKGGRVIVRQVERPPDLADMDATELS